MAILRSGEYQITSSLKKNIYIYRESKTDLCQVHMEIVGFKIKNFRCKAITSSCNTVCGCHYKRISRIPDILNIIGLNIAISLSRRDDISKL